jgi:hypothetical protein
MFLRIIMEKVKIKMPEENKQPISQQSTDNNSQVVQPTTNTQSTVNEQQANPVVSSAPVQQPVAMANGQPFTLTSPISHASYDQQDDQKPSKWRYFFLVIGILQAAGISLFLLVMLWAAQQAKSGVSGTEFIALILFITVVPAVAVISLINVIGLPIYMRKNKPHGKGLILCGVSLLILDC